MPKLSPALPPASSPHSSPQVRESGARATLATQDVAPPRTFRQSDVASATHALQILESSNAALRDPDVRSGVIAQFSSASGLHPVRDQLLIAQKLDTGEGVQLRFIRYEKKRAGGVLDTIRSAVVDDTARSLSGIPMAKLEFGPRIPIRSAEDLGRALAQAQIPYPYIPLKRDASREWLFSTLAEPAASPAAAVAVTGPVTRTSLPPSSEPSRRWWER
jgi:hypothetical protein